MSTPTIHTERAGATLRLRLDGPLDIASAAATRLVLLRTCQDDPARELHFDLSAVHEADTAGVQLLQSTARLLQQTGRQGRVVACSANFRRIAAVLGACDGRQLCGMDLAPAAALATGAAA